MKNPEADRLARELAAQTGESLTDAVINALRERLERQRQSTGGTARKQILAEARLRLAKYPVLDRADR
ncbi:MAG TPA: type II toxin-antitoxin system VapB family antitoxin [Bryobacteraceae bacterium]|nr:type II toxin-antitoxin system VapB family antitoxin [Bryobacteraceae bacterium]